MDLHPTAHWRRDYELAELHEQHSPEEPWALFDLWLQQAQQAGEVEANAMTLATVDADGWPSARVVLLKGYDEQGFTFYSNRQSAKGQALAQQSRAALCFFWPLLQRQVRAEGEVTAIDDAVADAYFASRPRPSQLAAWASPQSQVIADRPALDDALQRCERQFAEGPVPRPPHWGGWLVTPRRLEFWQGRPSRLHDRLAYLRQDGGWQRQRLAP